MYCKYCGTEIDEKCVYCPSCGKPQGEEIKDDKPAKCWHVFALLGKIISILCLVMFALLGWCGLLSLVFGILGKKAKTPEDDKRSKTAIILSIIAMVLCLIFWIVMVVLLITNAIEVLQPIISEIFEGIGEVDYCFA